MAASIPQLSCPGLISRSQSALSEDGAASFTPQRPTLLTASKAILDAFGVFFFDVRLEYSLFFKQLPVTRLKSTWVWWKRACFILFYDFVKIHSGFTRQQFAQVTSCQAPLMSGS